MKKRYKLVLYKDLELHDNTFLITGFPGFGAVGYLATRYIIEKLQLERVGYIATPTIPDFTSLEDYGLSLPHEIFSKNLNNTSIIVLLNRINPLKSHLDSYVQSVLELVKMAKVKEVFLIGGLDARFRESDEEFRWLKTKHSMRNLNAPLFMKGPYIIGPLASLLIAFELHGVPALVILPYTEPETVNHRAAASAIKILSQLIGISIDVSELISYAEKLEQAEEALKQIMTTAEERKSMLYM